MQKQKSKFPIIGESSSCFTFGVSLNGTEMLLWAVQLGIFTSLVILGELSLKLFKLRNSNIFVVCGVIDYKKTCDVI